ncbi:MAG TPA: fumarylacetoacetate hydrolase family protein [Bryobacterales bacterium]|nr:fumarylacetoacetate hydrolase family protein [Bryobacterales bacterium]
MKLAQIRNHHGQLTAAIFESGGYRPIDNYTVAALIARAEQQGRPLAETAAALAGKDVLAGVQPDIPLCPPEVWACGCTYAPSAEFRDAELGTREGMYSYVYRAARPEIFFKGAARVCVGPGAPIGIRCDSKFTAPEPELAVVLNGRGEIQGYTLANDVSAWDIERENALYLPQSKIYTGCCALGPALVTPEEIANPYDLQMTCTITRGEETVFRGSVSTSKLFRRFEYLIEYLRRANPVPAATVLLTGTGIIVTEDAALQPGDVVSIEVREIGKLVNPAAVAG